jgi:hypothetical protein
LFPVLVRIRKVSEDLDPGTSVERLKSFNRCDMLGVQAFEPGPYVSGERLWAVVNGKLSPVLRYTAVVFSEFEDQIVEGRSKIIANIAQHDANDGRMRHLRSGVNVSFIRGLCIEMNPGLLQIVPPEDAEIALQFTEVFLSRPLDPYSYCRERC